jgi:hypothetical protein
MKLSQPWPEGYKINARSPYGWRRHPITGRRTFHHGVDVALPVGTPLTAPADGIVTHKGQGGSGGVTLILKHADDLFTVYYHLKVPSHLPKGSRFQRGQVIAHSGNTGASTGPHLHWEVRSPNSRWGTTVDPVPFLQGSPAVVPSPLKVDGRLGRNTWKAWQTALKAKGLFTGVPDGRPGPMTYKALQGWAGVKQDGILGPQTRRAVQEKLGVKPDGVWGRLTISALQRQLNEGVL